MEVRSVAALGLALLVAVIAAPAAVARDETTPPDGFYGVMWDRSAMTAPAALQDAQFALMRRSGVETVRTAFSWEDAQPRQNEPTNFARHRPARRARRAAPHRAPAGDHLHALLGPHPFLRRVLVSAAPNRRLRPLRRGARPPLRAGRQLLGRAARPAAAAAPLLADLERAQPSALLVDRQGGPLDAQLRPAPQRLLRRRQARRSRRQGRPRRSRQRVLARSAAALQSERTAAVRRRRHQPLHVESLATPSGDFGACEPSSIAPATPTSRYG